MLRAEHEAAPLTLALQVVAMPVRTLPGNVLLAAPCALLRKPATSETTLTRGATLTLHGAVHPIASATLEGTPTAGTHLPEKKIVFHYGPSTIQLGRISVQVSAPKNEIPRLTDTAPVSSSRASLARWGSHRRGGEGLVLAVGCRLALSWVPALPGARC